MSDYNINSKEYWNKRFKSDWDDFGGIQQTEFFAKLACELLPEWFIRDIKMKEYSFCDMGCALGNGVDVLSKFLGIKVSGKDFSEEAIETATELYPNYEFEQADITNLRSDNQYDVVFCSNVLEHFSDPWKIAQNLSNISIHYLVFLVPFREKLEIDEHVYKFDSNLIPLKIDKFNLIYSNSINGEKISNTYYPDQQILLIYSNRVEEHKITSLKDVSDAISKSDLIALEEEKNQLILQLEEKKNQVISQLEYENNQSIIRLEEEKNLLISQLEEEKNLLSQLKEEKNLLISQLEEGKKELINIQDEYESKFELMADKVKSLLEIKENQRKQIDDYNVKQTELYGKIDEYVKQIEELKSELANNVEIRTNLDNELNRLTIALFEKENIINKALMQTKNMTFSKLFKFVHFLNRFIYQGIKESKVERKKFRKWFRNKLNGSGDADHRYHPLYSIINILELNQTNEPFVVKSNKNYLSQIQDSELARHLNNENKRLATSFNGNSKEILKIREIIGERDYRGIIVYPHVVYWEPLQTPQQLLRAFAKEGWLCFFCEHPNKKDSFQEIETNLIITREKELLEALDDKEVTVLLTWIGSLSFVNRIKNKKIWYHILDKLDIFPYYSETYLKIHNDIVSTADYVSYVAKPLLKYIVNREETTYLPNGVTSNELLNQHEGYIPDDMIEIINKGNKIVGYYGYLAEWMDYDLIAEVAILRPEYEFVFIGKEIHDTSKISSIPNVHLLGLKLFTELSDYAKFFDVATIPFVINEMMDCVSPIKFYEYCALGLPVVASYMVEVASFACEFVACFNNKDEYLFYLDKFVRNDIKQLAQKEAPYIAKDNTWTSRAQTMVEKFNKNQQILLKSEYSNFDVIILSVIDFDFRYQRPQHFASRLAENGHRVFYINANHYNESSITEIEKNLYIVNFKNDDFTAIHLTDWKGQIEKLQNLIDKLLFDYCIRDAITIVDYPNWVLAAEYMRKNYGFKIVTDYMDDYTGFLNPAEKLVGKNCEKLLTISDVIIASSEFLFNIAIEYNKNVSIVRNGTEFEHFYESTKIQEVKERKIIGYYGAVAQWFDLDKVCYVADNLKECDIVIIGEITEGMNRLSKYSNIKLLGERPYSELPKHLASFDVCLIPFDTSTDLIKATNPVKFYEYLSAGKKL